MLHQLLRYQFDLHAQPGHPPHRPVFPSQWRARFQSLNSTRDTVANHMQLVGYHTGIIEKWHLDSDPQGFNQWVVLPGQGAYWNPTFLTSKSKFTIEGHCTDVTGDLGVEFLETRPQDKPFFLMLQPKAPRRAWEPEKANN